MARQSLEHPSTKGSQPSTHQCMMSMDTVMWREAQCKGEKGKIQLIPKVFYTQLLGARLVLWYQSAEGCKVGHSAVIPKGWKSPCEQAQCPPLTPNLPSPLGSGSLAVSHPPHPLSFLPFSSMCLTP